MTMLTQTKYDVTLDAASTGSLNSMEEVRQYARSCAGDISADSGGFAVGWQKVDTAIPYYQLKKGGTVVGEYPTIAATRLAAAALADALEGDSGTFMIEWDKITPPVSA